MTDTTDLQARLDALETHVAEQNRVIDELSDVAAKQWAEIVDLNERFERLKSKVQEVETGMSDTPSEEPPPPHY